MSIITDIRTELLDDSNISSVIGTRFYQRKPVGEPADPYITYFRQGKQRDDVREKESLRITCFSKDLAELETLANNVILNLDGKLILNDNEYYQIRLITQTDSEDKLTSGFYWNILNFEFSHTTE